MSRLLTGLILAPLGVWGTLKLPSQWFLVVVAIVLCWAALEFTRVARAWAPGAPLPLMVTAVPVVAVALSGAVSWPAESGVSVALGLAFLGSVTVGTAVLLARTPVKESMAALGIFAFGVPYFALPIASMHWLHTYDPRLVLLLFAVVWVGDTVAYYAGSRLGRHRMAPRISPKKSWEGAVAGFLGALVAAGVWGWLAWEEVSWPLLAVAGATSIAAMIGDLVESMIKRGAGVKDSGALLPGHGGMWDRADALLFAAPVLLFGLYLAGLLISNGG